MKHVSHLSKWLKITFYHLFSCRKKRERRMKESSATAAASAFYHFSIFLLLMEKEKKGTHGIKYWHSLIIHIMGDVSTAGLSVFLNAQFYEWARKPFWIVTAYLPFTLILLDSPPPHTMPLLTTRTFSHFMALEYQREWFLQGSIKFLFMCCVQIDLIKYTRFNVHACVLLD